LALLMAGETGMSFSALSAISSGVKEVRDVLHQAEQNSLFRSTNGHLLFIDEIHRFSKAQQDALLAAVEKGVVTLIGATTENPSFEVIPALLSRCQLYVLKSLSDDELRQLTERAVAQDDYLKSLSVSIREWDMLLALAGGDGRKMLNQAEWVLEQAEARGVSEVDNAFVESVGSRLVVQYDKGGEAHYDMASALIKSIRGSDPDAALYWAARMLVGGEPPACKRYERSGRVTMTRAKFLRCIFSHSVNKKRKQVVYGTGTGDCSQGGLVGRTREHASRISACTHNGS
jgi:putative ATPase